MGEPQVKMMEVAERVLKQSGSSLVLDFVSWFSDQKYGWTYEEDISNR